MLNKTMIAITAALILGSASTAFSNEDPENRIGDRYPLLERISTPVAATRLGNRNLMVRQVSNSVLSSTEDVENKIGDRYQSLEQIVIPAPAERFAGRYLTSRLAANSIFVQPASEEPDNRIGDRYPLLEQLVASRRGPGRSITAGRDITTGSIR